MLAEENKSLIHEFLDALSGKPKCAEVVHRYVSEQDEALRRFILHYEIAFPCFELIAQDTQAIGNCVLVHLCLRGIHTGDLWSLPPAGMQIAPPLRPSHCGEFMGIPPTGRAIVVPMTVLFRIGSGAPRQVVEHRMRYDADNMLQQLGQSPRLPHHTAELIQRQSQHLSLWREITQVAP